MADKEKWKNLHRESRSGRVGSEAWRTADYPFSGCIRGIMDVMLGRS